MLYLFIPVDFHPGLPKRGLTAGQCIQLNKQAIIYKIQVQFRQLRISKPKHSIPTQMAEIVLRLFVLLGGERLVLECAICTGRGLGTDSAAVPSTKRIVIGPAGP